MIKTDESNPAGGGSLDILALRRRDFDALLFDMDGVITSTVEMHEAAWKATFDAFFEARGGAAPFTHEDYRRHVDGKPRDEGVRDFLKSRGIELPVGATDDRTRTSERGLAAAKQRRFRKLLEQHGARTCPGAVRLLAEARASRLRTGLFTASKNAALVLRSAGLVGVFDARVDGLDAARLNLRGKPEPDTPLALAKMLDAAPERCALFEDAPAGVQAGRAGRFGLVVGVGSGKDAELLKAAGADAVVPDLAHVRLMNDDG